MQVIVFDKFFKCVYRLRNIPRDGHFDKVAEVLDLQHAPSEYEAFRLDDSAPLCVDEFIYRDGELQLTSCDCD